MSQTGDLSNTTTISIDGAKSLLVFSSIRLVRLQFFHNMIEWPRKSLICICMGAPSLDWQQCLHRNFVQQPGGW
jgi:hypothetical protein